MDPSHSWEVHVHEIAEAIKVGLYLNTSDFLPWTQKRRENELGTKLQNRGKVIAEKMLFSGKTHYQTREHTKFS